MSTPTRQLLCHGTASSAITTMHTTALLSLSTNLQTKTDGNFLLPITPSGFCLEVPSMQPSSSLTQTHVLQNTGPMNHRDGILARPIMPMNALTLYQRSAIFTITS